LLSLWRGLARATAEPARARQRRLCLKVLGLLSFVIVYGAYLIVGI
jgi:hypothetical protein